VEVLVRSTILATFVVSILLVPDARAAGDEIVWAGCGITYRAFMKEMAVAFEKSSGIKVRLDRGSATDGIRKVAAKKADIGGTCRRALNIPEEQHARLVPVAWDALIVAVHPTNSVRELTMDQLRKVFTGEITNWSELGGRDAPIEVLAREGKRTGVGMSARELIFNNKDMDYTETVKTYPSSGPLEDALEKSPAGIAITGFASAARRKIKVLALEGKMPTRQSVAAGEYILYRPLYITLRTDTTDPRVQKFLKYVLSRDGQKVISSTGTVNLREGKGLWAKYKAAMRSLGD
jgi:phosphate transport system substrate-binding protein